MLTGRTTITAVPELPVGVIIVITMTSIRHVALTAVRSGVGTVGLILVEGVILIPKESRCKSAALVAGATNIAVTKVFLRENG
jgi:hypothetical protein